MWTQRTGGSGPCARGGTQLVRTRAEARVGWMCSGVHAGCRVASKARQGLVSVSTGTGTLPSTSARRPARQALSLATGNAGGRAEGCAECWPPNRPVELSVQPGGCAGVRAYVASEPPRGAVGTAGRVCVRACVRGSRSMPRRAGRWPAEWVCRRACVRAWLPFRPVELMVGRQRSGCARVRACAASEQPHRAVRSSQVRRAGVCTSPLLVRHLV